MTVTPASLQGLFPEFAAQTTPRLQLFIDQASRRVSASTWGTLYDDGVAYLAAHLLTMSLRRGAGGPLTGRTVGPVSAQFAAPPIGVTGSYGTTGYGQEYTTLVRLLGQTPVAV